MSWITELFRKESTKIIVQAALSILKVLMGKMAGEVWKIVQEEVVRAEALNEGSLSGHDKFKHVANAVKGRIPGVKDYMLNLVIELAVTHFKESMIKR